jgi:histidinol-phosphate phosphatase family protein
MTTALILAGGRGTRSGNPELAKICVQIGGKSLLQHHFDLLASSQVTDVVVVAGFAGDQVSRALKEANVHGLKPRLLVEESPNGVMNALQWTISCGDLPEEESLLVLLGDVLMSFRIDEFLYRWEGSQKPIGVVVHPSTHPLDSDTVFECCDGFVHAAAKGTVNLEIPNMSSAGVFAILRSELGRFSNEKDFGSDVLPKAARANRLFVYKSSHYLKDTGTASRLALAQDDFSSGVFARRGSLLPRPAIFLDRDGVINPILPESPSPNEYRLCDGVAEAIAKINLGGVPVFVVTNQPGIAKGFFSEKHHQAVRARMDALLAQAGGFVDDYIYCPHHPESGFEGEVPSLKRECWCRKPETNMVEELVRHHHLDIGRSVVVGDSWRDQELARRIGTRFVHVATNNVLPGVHATFGDSAKAILWAMELLS